MYAVGSASRDSSAAGLGRPQVLSGAQEPAAESYSDDYRQAYVSSEPRSAFGLAKKTKMVEDSGLLIRLRQSLLLRVRRGIRRISGSIVADESR
jgi:hypothetical protein